MPRIQHVVRSRDALNDDDYMLYSVVAIEVTTIDGEDTERETFMCMCVYEDIARTIVVALDREVLNVK